MTTMTKDMTSNIVERLRSEADNKTNEWIIEDREILMREAADVIERLRKYLNEALDDIERKEETWRYCG